MADEAGVERQAVWSKAVNSITEQYGAPKCSILNILISDYKMNSHINELYTNI